MRGLSLRRIASSVLVSAYSEVIRFIAVVLLFIAIGDQPDAYYIVLRYIIFIVALYEMWSKWNTKKYLWLWLFGFIAFLFNPFIVVHLTRPLWIIIDCATAATFIISYPVLKIDVRSQNRDEESLEKQERILKDKKRKNREIGLWEKSRACNELQEIKNFIIAELGKMKETHWEYYALDAILKHSPEFSALLINGQLDLVLISASERNGINNAINAINKTSPEQVNTLRAFFHSMFKEIYRETSYAAGNKFYWFGRDRVIQSLRSYNAKTNTFETTQAKFYDEDGTEFGLDTKIDDKTIERVRTALDYMERKEADQEKINKLKKYYKFKIESEHPIFEFDLELIEKASNFKYEGSLANCLFIELTNLLYLVSDYAYLETRGISMPLYDFKASSFAYEEGIIVLIIYKGVVEYYPDRLYVELQDIDPDGWLVRWLKSYKMHLEGND